KFFLFSSRRRHTRSKRDWSSDVCSSDLILGVAIAILMKLSPMIERTIYPILITSQTIPVIALAPIFVLWFGYSIWGKVVMTTLITFFPITVSTIDGFRSSSKQMEE